jgi:hypothetical protein
VESVWTTLPRRRTEAASVVADCDQTLTGPVTAPSADGTMYRVDSYPGRSLVTVGYVIWAASVLYVGACLAAPSIVGDMACQTSPGSSVYGQATRSWLPPEPRAPTT